MQWYSLVEVAEGVCGFLVREEGFGELVCGGGVRLGGVGVSEGNFGDGGKRKQRTYISHLDRPRGWRTGFRRRGRGSALVELWPPLFLLEFCSGRVIGLHFFILSWCSSLFLP